MARLIYQLYNGARDRNPMRSISDDTPTHLSGAFIHNLNKFNCADKAAAIKVVKGPSYRRGDHIRLLDQVKNGLTDTICIDPDIHRYKVDLNKIIHNNRNFADRAAAVQIIHNPNPTGGFRLRIRLYDQVPRNSTEEKYPTLILYDWNFPLIDLKLLGLHHFNLGNKIAFIKVDRGPNYVSGDRIVIYDHNYPNSAKLVLDAGKKYNLNSYNFADKASQIQFLPAPQNAHLIVDLYDNKYDTVPVYTLNDTDLKANQSFVNLNIFGIADKISKVIIKPGKKYVRGDHILLLDQVNTNTPDTIAIDPAINFNVDLSRIIFNNRGFQERTAGVKFITNRNLSNNYRLRIRFYDKMPIQSALNYPTLAFYDWQFKNLDNISLNKYRFADKASAILVEKGPQYVKDDRIVVMDDPGRKTNLWTLYEGVNPHNLIKLGAANKVAYFSFDLVQPDEMKERIIVKLFEDRRQVLTLTRSDPGSLNNRPGNHNYVYSGHATRAEIHGPKGLGVTFFDDQEWRTGENSVRIKKNVSGPITVYLSYNFVAPQEQKGEGIYYGQSPNKEFDWIFFRKIKKTTDVFGILLKGVLTAVAGEMGYVAGEVLLKTNLMGNKNSSGNFRVDNCSSIYFDTMDM